MDETTLQAITRATDVACERLMNGEIWTVTGHSSRGPYQGACKKASHGFVCWKICCVEGRKHLIFLSCSTNAKTHGYTLGDAYCGKLSTVIMTAFSLATLVTIPTCRLCPCCLSYHHWDQREKECQARFDELRGAVFAIWVIPQLGSLCEDVKCHISAHLTASVLTHCVKRRSLRA